MRNVLLNADRETEVTCRLIRLGPSYVSADGDQNMLELATQLMTQQLRDELLTLTETQTVDSEQPAAELPASAIQMARKQSAALVEVSEVRLDLNTGTASVQLTLYQRPSAEANAADVESADESWLRVGSVLAEASVADVDPDRSSAIAKDPQVGPVLKFFESIGSGQQDVTRALVMGAVVEAAQRNAQRKLNSLIPPLLEYARLPGIAEITLSELPER